MSHPYFFINPDNINESEIIIEGEDFDHFVKTLRAKSGDSVDLSDNRCFRFAAKVKSVQKKSVLLEIISKKEISRDFLQLDLYQSILKKNAMDLIIQKSAEIGITNIIPVFTIRIIPNEKPDNKKYARWQKIALEASKQSKRNFICKISPAEDIHDICFKNYDLFLFAYEELSNLKSESKNIINVINEVKNKKPSYKAEGLKIAFLTGPEGGFEKSEADFLISKGAIAVSLGSNILKAETASIFTASVIKYCLQ